MHTVWLVRRLTRRPTPGCGAHQEEGVARRHDSPRTLAASSRHSSVASARAPPGSMAPVMSMLFAAQTDITGDLTGKEALKRFDKAPDVSRMGMFTNHPNTLEQACGCSRTSPSWLSNALRMERATSPCRSFICSSPARLPKNSENCGKYCAERHRPASTTGIAQGSKIYVAFLNFFAAYRTTSDRRKFLQMADAFS